MDPLEGDVCFAHVKSHPWWPARVSKKVMKKSQVWFSVVFFGTMETATLPSKDVIPVTDSNIKRYVTKGLLKRKLFKKGWDELLLVLNEKNTNVENIEVLEEHNEMLEEEPNVGGDYTESNETYASKQKFLGLFGLEVSGVNMDPTLPALASAAVPSVKPVVVSEHEHIEVVNDDDFDDDYGDVLPTPVNIFSKLHPARNDSGPKDISDIDEDDDDIFNVQNKKKSKDTASSTRPKHDRKDKKSDKKAAKKKSGSGHPKLVRTLQEDEMETNKLFAENIEMKEDFYFCKLCTKFSCSTKMRAKSHAIACGKGKKKGRPSKVSMCLHCDKVFPSRKELIQHNRIHSSLEYTCSICLKTFLRRNSYLRHIKSHKEPPSYSCETCGKAFRYNCDLKRHKKTHTKISSAVFNPVPATENEDTEVIEIDLEEVRKGGEYFGKLVIKESEPSQSYQKSYTSFESSLGSDITTIDDWNAFVDFSNNFGLPLSTFGPNLSAESCVYTNRSGQLTIQFAWSSVKSPEDVVNEVSGALGDKVVVAAEDIVSDIISEVVDDAVVLGILNDPELEKEELSEVVDDIISNILGKYDIIAQELEFRDSLAGLVDEEQKVLEESVSEALDDQMEGNEIEESRVVDQDQVARLAVVVDENEESRVADRAEGMGDDDDASAGGTGLIKVVKKSGRIFINLFLIFITEETYIVI